MSQRIIYDVKDRQPAPAALKVQDYMISLVREMAPRRVLEVGSGVGRVGRGLVDAGIDYVGLEPDEGQIEYAWKTYPDIKFVKSSCYDDPASLGLGMFDMVISNDVIEHLYEPRKLISFKEALLKPQGTCVTCTPNYGYYHRNLMIAATGRWEKHHNPLWDGGHIKFFSKKTLQRIHGEQGFRDFKWRYIRSIKIPVTSMSIVCICVKE